MSKYDDWISDCVENWNYDFVDRLKDKVKDIIKDMNNDCYTVIPNYIDTDESDMYNYDYYNVSECPLTSGELVDKFDVDLYGDVADTIDDRIRDDFIESANDIDMNIEDAYKEDYYESLTEYLDDELVAEFRVANNMYWRMKLLK